MGNSPEPEGDFWGSIGKIGLASSFPLVGGLLSSAFDSLTGGGGGGGGGPLSPKEMQALINDGFGMFNEAGYRGKDVQNTFARALSQHRNSANALNTFSDSNQAADNLLSTAGTQTNLARQSSENANKQLLRGTTDTLRMAGASPAALIAATGKINDAMSGNNLNLLDKAGQINSNALAQSAALRQQGMGTLLQDSDLRYKQYVDPYKAQVDSGAVGLLGGANSTAASMAENSLYKQPLGGFAQALGNVGGEMMKDATKDGLFTSILRKNSSTSTGGTQPNAQNKTGGP